MDAALNDIGLVVQLHADQHGVWVVEIQGSIAPLALALQPAIFIIRLSRVGTDGGLRGTIALPAHNLATPIQCNASAGELVRAWLLGGGQPNPAEESG